MAKTSEISAWLLHKLLPAEGDTAPEYVTISPQEGTSGRRPAYVQRAKVRVNERPAAAVADAVLHELEEISSSRAAEGTTLHRVKVLVYGPKGAEVVGDRVFVVGEAGSEEHERGADAPQAREGELLGAFRQLAESNAQLVREMRLVCAGGMTIAAEALREANAARQELAEARGALIVAENTQAYEPMRELVETLKPLVPVVVPMIVSKLNAANP
jgi:vacuolar-type H+-ATPase subunit F/Vma7